MMDIYAGSGTLVIFTHPNNGYPGDQKEAAKFLEVGEVYTVEKTDVANWMTRVYLQEIPNVSFDSAMFE